MRTITYTKTVYKYNELSEAAKDKVKQWILDGIMPEWYEEQVKDDLSILFPHSELNVEFSLAFCQGDGLNTYGVLDFGDAIEYVKDYFTTKEIAFLQWIAKTWGYDIKLEQNQRYGYSMKDQLFFAETIYLDLIEDGYREIKKDILYKFEKVLKRKLSALDNEFEINGYEFFYEISDEQAEEECELNNYEFDINGNLA